MNKKTQAPAVSKGAKALIERDHVINAADNAVFRECLPVAIDGETERLFRLTATYDAAFHKHLKAYAKGGKKLKPANLADYTDVLPDIETFVKRRGDRIKLRYYGQLAQQVRQTATFERETALKPFLPHHKLLGKLVNDTIPKAVDAAIDTIKVVLQEDRLKVYKRDEALAFYLPNRPGTLFSDFNIHVLIQNLVDLPKGNISLAAKYISEKTNYANFLFHTMIDTYAEIRALMADPDTAYIEEDLYHLCRHSAFDRVLSQKIQDTLSYSALLTLVKTNAAYAKRLKTYAFNERKKRELDKVLLEHIPKNYADLYPTARQMTRHFIVHIGPTNSGKTHDALVRLEQADSGLYLAPLRLLAYEQFERLNQDGVHCSLITGEEKVLDETAQIASATVEMADFEHYYDVVVIDEAQMAADEHRGGAWTAAILGLCADEIHLCAAPKAEALLIRMIESCGDTYEIVRHHRLTKLAISHAFLNFPDDVRSGDALIVFTRKSVHGVALELKQHGIACSIIYGSLPYDVRHRQAEAFASGKTQVVVATDAIGMGMNLPIRRVVFLEEGKFDGTRWRGLSAEEIRQIGGRAGRYGMYDVGYVDSFVSYRMLEKAFDREDRPLTDAVVSIPRTLIDIDADLSEILRHWIALPVSKGYIKREAERELMLCREMEAAGCVDKHFIFKMMTMAFDETDEEMHQMWRAMYTAENKGKAFDAPAALPDLSADELKTLERAYRICDLLYQYANKCGHETFIAPVNADKQQLSEKMMQLLDRDQLENKKCPGCGRKLPWAYPYSLCDDCYEQKHGRPRSDFDGQLRLYL